MSGRHILHINGLLWVQLFILPLSKDYDEHKEKNSISDSQKVCPQRMVTVSSI